MHFIDSQLVERVPHVVYKCDDRVVVVLVRDSYAAVAAQLTSDNIVFAV